MKIILKCNICFVTVCKYRVTMQYGNLFPLTVRSFPVELVEKQNIIVKMWISTTSWKEF